jgi:hypothetical protein
MYFSPNVRSDNFAETRLGEKTVHPHHGKWHMTLLRSASTASVTLLLLLSTGCGTRTTGFFAGLPGSGSRPDSTYYQTSGTYLNVAAWPDAADTLLNCTFESVLDEPFGPCPYEVYNGALHIDNSVFAAPVVLLSTGGLLDNGLVEAQFDLVEADLQSVVGVVLGAESAQDLLLLGVNSRGQYTVQKCMNGMWIPVMGLEAFESSRLLPYSLPGVTVSAEVNGCYVDLRVNGQLIQVVRTALPALGQVGVFVDSYTEAELDRFTVVPAL